MSCATTGDFYHRQRLMADTRIPHELQHGVATAGETCVADVEEIVDPCELEPSQNHAKIYVHRLIQGSFEKPIEKRTGRAARGESGGTFTGTNSPARRPFRPRSPSR